MELFWLVFVVLITGLLSISGGILVLFVPKIAEKIQKILSPILILVLFSVAFLDLLPEAVEGGLKVWQAYGIMAIGIVAFFALDKFLHRFHHHGHSDRLDDGEVEVERHHRSAWMMVGVDSLHSLVDGLIIGVAFAVNLETGIATAISVAIHEIPQEIGDFAMLKRSRMNNRKIIIVQLFAVLLLVVGALVAFNIGEEALTNLPIFLALTAGFFLEIALQEIPIYFKSITGRDKQGEKAHPASNIAQNSEKVNHKHQKGDFKI